MHHQNELTFELNSLMIIFTGRIIRWKMHSFVLTVSSLQMLSMQLSFTQNTYNETSASYIQNNLVFSHVNCPFHAFTNETVWSPEQQTTFLTRFYKSQS